MFEVHGVDGYRIGLVENVHFSHRYHSTNGWYPTNLLGVEMLVRNLLNFWISNSNLSEGIIQLLSQKPLTKLWHNRTLVVLGCFDVVFCVCVSVFHFNPYVLETYITIKLVDSLHFRPKTNILFANSKVMAFH